MFVFVFGGKGEYLNMLKISFNLKPKMFLFCY